MTLARSRRGGPAPSRQLPPAVDLSGLERVLAELQSDASEEELGRVHARIPVEIAKVRRQLMRYPAARLLPVAVNGSVKRGVDQGWFKLGSRQAPAVSGVRRLRLRRRPAQA